MFRRMTQIMLCELVCSFSVSALIGKVVPENSILRFVFLIAEKLRIPEKFLRRAVCGRFFRWFCFHVSSGWPVFPNGIDPSGVPFLFGRQIVRAFCWRNIRNLRRRGFCREIKKTGSTSGFYIARI